MPRGAGLKFEAHKSPAEAARRKGANVIALQKLIALSAAVGVGMAFALSHFYIGADAGLVAGIAAGITAAVGARKFFRS